TQTSGLRIPDLFYNPPYQEEQRKDRSECLDYRMASKAALFDFYETLRIEVGKDVGITILSPGLIDIGIT
ncbi:hypothetical protein RJ641_008969, partial [Dillenia turbinata]